MIKGFDASALKGEAQVAITLGDPVHALAEANRVDIAESSARLMVHDASSG